ncbi:MAG: SAM-dependent methyltransferase [Clostridia bacterium]|nr:SAM-dependent methyltransferase [Clostridia bacterium]
MFNLSKRLLKIAELVPKNSRVADIGTDHGYLPIYLIKNGVATSVLACDINQKPLNNAKKNIQRSNVLGIQTRLCGGLSGITADEVETIIIAGIGGEVIAGILENCSWVKNKKYTLLLNPTTSPEKLRDFLYSTGFSTDLETAVCENGKCYTIIKTKFTGEFCAPQEYKLYIGELKPDSPHNVLYIKKQLSRLQKLNQSIKNIPLKQPEFLKTQTCINQIKKQLEAQNGT